MTDRAAEEARAKSRFMLLSLLRLTGVVMLMAGFVLIAGRWELLGDGMDRYLGVALVLIGAFDFSVAPFLLARSWKRQDRA